MSCFRHLINGDSLLHDIRTLDVVTVFSRAIVCRMIVPFTNERSTDDIDVIISLVDGLFRIQTSVSRAAAARHCVKWLQHVEVLWWRCCWCPGVICVHHVDRRAAGHDQAGLGLQVCGEDTPATAHPVQDSGRRYYELFKTLLRLCSL